MDEKETNNGSLGELPEDIQRWTAKRRAALAMSILKGETTAAEAARRHGLTVADVENWEEAFLLAAENALRSRQLVRAIGVRGRVDFVGPQPPLAVATAMRRSRAFVQHSVVTGYGDREGTPVAVLEAMSSGLAVAATRHAGIADLVTEGETGFLVPEYDVESMAASMLRLAIDPALAARMGTTARQRILDGFTVEASIGRLAGILSSAARPHRD